MKYQRREGWSLKLLASLLHLPPNLIAKHNVDLLLQNGELDHAREKLSKSTREQISQQAEIRTLTV